MTLQDIYDAKARSAELYKTETERLSSAQQNLLDQLNKAKTLGWLSAKRTAAEGTTNLAGLLGQGAGDVLAGRREGGATGDVGALQTMTDWNLTKAQPGMNQLLTTLALETGRSEMDLADKLAGLSRDKFQTDLQLAQFAQAEKLREEEEKPNWLRLIFGGAAGIGAGLLTANPAVGLGVFSATQKV